MKLWLLFSVIFFLTISFLPVLYSQTQSCDYQRVCMNWSICDENNTKYRFCYDINNCTGNYIDIEYAECNYLFETHCLNSIKDLDETDVDCGGSCSACSVGKSCLSDEDCETNACDLVDFKCVEKSEKRGVVKAFAHKHQFDFMLIVSFIYAALFFLSFYFFTHSFRKQEKEFNVEISRKRMQGFIDLFYLFLSRKDFKKAKLAYSEAMRIAENISDYLPENDLRDLEELRDDYEKFIANQHE